ncbi:3-oxoacyl-ACP reductase [Pseudoduganella sp. FT93W]|uniref:3-oxoacyl-ACP reductase n=1 Tax=Duganella fentianensis TaxID=2692177 RepID=A0A845HX72_9BURK|nr:3-oxoacyl-ACP reductase [Duganella fentianensis]MYN45740.1 3-oxoacyl-ACP reductase [Duganella fentianensis]
MADFLTTLNRNPLTAPLAKALGLPNPVPLARSATGYETTPYAGKAVLLQAAPNSYAHASLLQAVRNGGGEPVLSGFSEKLDVAVFDATGCSTPADAQALYETFHGLARKLAVNGRVLIVAALHDDSAAPVAVATARGVEGFARSLGKELGRKGVTVNLAYVAPDAVERLEGVVRFFCGTQTTYVSGQAVRVTATAAVAPAAPAPAYSSALAGKVALVTGSARGIGLAVAERLLQEGAQVVCLDVPAVEQELQQTCARIGALPLALDIAAPDAPARLSAYFRERFGGLDILIHNAGITRDRTIANMTPVQWDQVLAVNFAAITEIDKVLLQDGTVRDGGRVVCLSSISGIAGNFGQTNYAYTKAALIGYVAAQAGRLGARGICINAVAPGFIETAMTAKMPFFMREMGRRLNSVQQGGQPRDAAELITFLATPGASGLTGNTIRVCGQGLIGA